MIWNSDANCNTSMTKSSQITFMATKSIATFWFFIRRSWNRSPTVTFIKFTTYLFNVGFKFERWKSFIFIPSFFKRCRTLQKKW
jgi:hypothetical protein